MICSWSQDYTSLISGQSPFTAILGSPSPSCPWGSCLLGPQTLLKNKKALVRLQGAEETGCGGLSLMEGAYWCQDKTVANIKPMLQLSMGTLYTHVNLQWFCLQFLFSFSHSFKGAFLFLNIYFCLFIWLHWVLAVDTWDLQSLLWHMNS